MKALWCRKRPVAIFSGNTMKAHRYRGPCDENTNLIFMCRVNTASSSVQQKYVILANLQYDITITICFKVNVIVRFINESRYISIGRLLVTACMLNI